MSSETFENQNPLEIERKFLIRQLPTGLGEQQGERIEQGYLAIDANLTEVRLRHRGEKYYLTVKGAGMVIRNEWEMEIPENQFNKFWPATIGRRLTKTRYEIPYENVMIEIDIYADKLKGLVTAEVEFKSEAEMERFVPPAWLGEEVTTNNDYRNKNLITLNELEIIKLLQSKL